MRNEGCDDEELEKAKEEEEKKAKEELKRQMDLVEERNRILREKEIKSKAIRKRWRDAIDRVRARVSRTKT